MVDIKTYMFNHFYQQNLVLLTMPPRNRRATYTSTGSSHPAKTVVGRSVLFPENELAPSYAEVIRATYDVCVFFPAWCPFFLFVATGAGETIRL